jgi:hypothetical protein
MFESFKNCGAGALAMLFLGLFGLLACALALLLTMTRRASGGIISAAAAIALALLSFAAGPAFAWYGRGVTDSTVSALGSPGPEQEKLRQMGYAEAESCVSVGLSLGAMPLVAGCIALLVAVRAKKRLASSSPPA